MIIREYEEADKSAVQDLLVELQKFIVKIDKFHLNILTKDYKEKYFENFYKETNENSGKIFLAVEGGKVVGLANAFVCQYDDLDRVIYKCPKKGLIAELIVSNKHRKRGTGKALISACENYLKSIGCEYIQLDVFAYNENAEKFYDHLGYEPRVKTLFKKI